LVTWSHHGTYFENYVENYKELSTCVIACMNAKHELSRVTELDETAKKAVQDRLNVLKTAEQSTHDAKKSHQSTIMYRTRSDRNGSKTITTPDNTWSRPLNTTVNISVSCYLRGVCEKLAL
jgi:hypothetical protein